MIRTRARGPEFAEGRAGAMTAAPAFGVSVQSNADPQVAALAAALGQLTGEQREALAEALSAPQEQGGAIPPGC